MILWTECAFGGERDGLPALPVERPLAVPRGWSLLTVGVTGRPDTTRGAAALRYGVLPRVELDVAGGLVVRDGSVRSLEPVLGGRFQVFRREPPNTSVAVDLRWDRGLGAGVLAARRVGPLLGTVGVRGWWHHEPVGAASATVLLQVGPLAPWGSLSAATTGKVEPTAGLVVQLSRGLGVQGAVGRDDATLSVEVAF